MNNSMFHRAPETSKDTISELFPRPTPYDSSIVDNYLRKDCHILITERENLIKFNEYICLFITTKNEEFKEKAISLVNESMYFDLSFVRYIRGSYLTQILEIVSYYDFDLFMDFYNQYRRYIENFTLDFDLSLAINGGSIDCLEFILISCDRYALMKYIIERHNIPLFNFCHNILLDNKINCCDQEIERLILRHGDSMLYQHFIMDFGYRIDDNSLKHAILCSNYNVLPYILDIIGYNPKYRFYNFVTDGCLKIFDSFEH